MSRFRMNTTYDIPINICLKLAWRIPKRLIHYNHKCRRFIFGVDFVWAMWIRRIESILLTITINMYSTVYNFLFCLTHEVHHNWPSNIRPQWDHIFYHWRRFLPQMTLGFMCTCLACDLPSSDCLCSFVVVQCVSVLCSYVTVPHVWCMSQWSSGIVLDTML